MKFNGSQMDTFFFVCLSHWNKKFKDKSISKTKISFLMLSWEMILSQAVVSSNIIDIWAFYLQMNSKNVIQLWWKTFSVSWNSSCMNICFQMFNERLREGKQKQKQKSNNGFNSPFFVYLTINEYIYVFILKCIRCQNDASNNYICSLICETSNNFLCPNVHKCLFVLLSLSSGPPDKVSNCISNHSMSTLFIECLPGDNNGLTQIFHAEVFSGFSSNIERNLTNPKKPAFLISDLIPGSTYIFHIYSSNSKGRSHSFRLMATTLGEPEKQMSQGKNLKSKL